jgi:NAD-dependent SIR2 family protein deacetylase
MAEIPEEKLVECHGHFRSASCIQCGKEADIHSVKESITVHQKPPVCQHCTSSTHSKSKASRQPAYVKPDIVFFGENLPNRFFKSLQSDLEVADLCLILGTSLRVPPTAWIPDEVSSSCKRVLLNRELVGNLKVGSERDAFHAGDCDDSILWIARLLGWEDELLEKHESTRIKAKIAAQKIAKNKNVET